MNDFGMNTMSILIKSDNSGSMSLINSNKLNAATKDIDVSYHLARYYIDESSNNATFLRSIGNGADRMAKALLQMKFILNRCALGLFCLSFTVQNEKACYKCGIDAVLTTSETYIEMYDGF